MVVLVIMGVCGSGKTTVGQRLASMMKCVFRDADEFHSDENKLKMSSGIPLNDEDRIPWLLAIHRYITELLDNETPGVVTCSALKQYYRQLLVHGDQAGDTKEKPVHTMNILFVYLKGTASVIGQRLKERSGHFMPASLLQSQLETLEEPDKFENHLTVDVDNDVDAIVDDVKKYVSDVFEKKV